LLLFGIPRLISLSIRPNNAIAQLMYLKEWLDFVHTKQLNLILSLIWVALETDQKKSLSDNVL